jgi:hypothetical protein
LSLVSKLFILVGLVLISYGGFVAWPLIYATTHYTEVRGRIIEVFSERLPDDQVRVTIAYDFPVPSRQGRIIAIGHAQWDSSMKRVDGITIPAIQLARCEHELIHQAPMRRVFFAVNDPIGTAFMLTDLDAKGTLGKDQGLMLIIAGLVMWCAGFLVRRRPA